jgi:hypothetical protein
MRPLIIASLAAPLVALAALPAAAQPVAYGPPGACECPPPAPVAPMIAAPAPAALPSWSIGLRLTSIGVHPANTDGENDQSNFGGGGVEVRYRLAPRWELGLSLESAREVLEDGNQGDREMRLSMLSARFHLDPYATWDIFFTGGVGGAAVVPADLRGDVPKDAVRAAGTLGAGIERRFGHFGLAAELRVLSVAPADASSSDASQPMATASATGTTTPPPPPSPATDDPGSIGGAFSLTASYEF